MIVDCAVYRKGLREDRPPTIEGACDTDGPDAFTWIGLHEPTEDEVEDVSMECGLHELLLEDMAKAHQRAKKDHYDEATFFVFKTVRYRQPDRVEIGELQVIVGRYFVITVRHGQASPLRMVRRRLEHNPEFLAHGPVAVLYGIADQVVDDYAPVISELEVDIDEAEEQVFSSSRTNQAQRVFFLKRQVLEMHRNIHPLEEVLDTLGSTGAGIVPEELRHYFRDVADHAKRVFGRVDVARELLTDALNANLAQVSVHQNDDMRRISAWAAIIAAPTLLAGIWGMNFEHMPELDSQVGYPLALLLIVAVSVTLWFNFRRAGWL